MPIYEYTCQNCRRRFTWLIGVVASSDPPTCDRCGSREATRREVSRFSRLRSESDVIGSIPDPDALDSDDPATLRQWAKDVSREMGDEMGEEFDEYIEDASSDDED